MQKFTLLLILAALQALATSGAAADKSEAGRRAQIVAFAPACPYIDDPAVIGAASPSVILGLLVPKLLEIGVDLGAAALKKAAEDQVDSVKAVSAAAPLQVLADGTVRWNPATKCIVFIDGYFADSSGTPDPIWTKHPAFNTLLDSHFCQGKGGCIRAAMVRPPHAYLQAEVSLDSDGNATLTPTGAYFGQPVAERRVWGGGDTRDLTLTLTLATPGADKPFGSMAISLQDLSPGTWLPRADLTSSIAYIGSIPLDAASKTIEKRKGQKSDFMTHYGVVFPQADKPAEEVAEDSKAVKDALAAYCKRAKTELRDEYCQGGFGEVVRNLARARAEATAEIIKARSTAWLQKACARAKSLKDCTISDHVVPEAVGLTIASVTATETAKGSEFLRKVADAIAQSKGDIAKAVAAEILPDERKKNKVAREEAESKAKRELEEARDAVRLAQAEYDGVPSDAKATDRLAAEIALRRAKMDANAKARAAGEGKPHPELP